MTFITLRERPELKGQAATWFHEKWGVPTEAYLECMTAYLNGETEYGWYMCLDDEQIIGGMGVIANDFHDRKDLTPNVCAVYTEEAYRCRGIAGELLNMVVEDMRAKDITPLYLVTDHTGFYERYGWEFLCMVQGDGEPNSSEIVIDRPKGSAHPKFPDFIYRVDYGYLKDTSSMDGAGIDVWVGSGEKKVDAIMCIVDLAKRDSEIKILIGCTEEEKMAVYKTHNETQFMKGILIRR